MNKDSKNEDAWVKLFEKYRILDQIKQNGQFTISADQIKEFREPRLMTKFDSKSQLPSIFKASNLSILPITRGSYSISNYRVYHRFEELETPVLEVAYPEYIQSINWAEITSESTAINVAYISQMLATFLEEENLLPTVNGRMGSSQFNFDIYNTSLRKDQRIRVMNSQIEIDGGFEGYNSLALIEAKNVLSEDFLIRQLYYPFRLWTDKVAKPVRTVYLTYSNNIFSLYEYQFEEPHHYNSLKLIRSNRYALKEEAINLSEILNIANSVDFVSEDPFIPFVQADSFYRVINLGELLIEHSGLTLEEIAYEFGFAVRQSDYYFNAGKYLGLFQKVRREEEQVVMLTFLGRKIMDMKVKERNLTLVKLIFSHRVFHEIFVYYLKNQMFPGVDEYIEIMKKHNLNIGEGGYEMYRRRRSSITGWINWIVSLINE